MSRVLLPDPDGPIRAMNSLPIEGKVDVVQHLDLDGRGDNVRRDVLVLSHGSPPQDRGLAALSAAIAAAVTPEVDRNNRTD